LHFDGNAAPVVRWIGGPHVNSHIDIKVTLGKLRPILVSDIYSEISRILRFGAPVQCNAEKTEENFQAYQQYGNHSFVTDNQDIFEKTIVKQSKRGLMLIMDKNLMHFALNAHRTLQGLLDVLHHRCKPRPIFESSFQPYPWSFAINDWTSKTNEPPLHFSGSRQRFCQWHWNLTITYPMMDR
jgi:hypothetical protein